MTARPALVASCAIAPLALWLGWTAGWLLEQGQRAPAYRVPVAAAP